MRNVFENKKIYLVILAAVFLCISCGSRNEEPFVYQKFPIDIESDKVVQLNLKKLVGDHPIGIRCSSSVWQELVNNQKQIAVQIKSINGSTAKVSAVEPGLMHTTCDSVQNCHYLFTAGSLGDCVLDISFPKLPASSKAEIIVCETPEQTENPF